MKGISVTLEKKQLEWLEDQVRIEKFASISHGLRYAVKELMKKAESVPKNHKTW